jgi:hypothetical protein
LGKIGQNWAKLGKIGQNWAKFRHLGTFFCLWAHFFLKNISQIILGTMFIKKIAQTAPKKFQISATFCLYLNSQILSYLARLQFGRYLDDIG